MKTIASMFFVMMSVFASAQVPLVQGTDNASPATQAIAEANKAISDKPAEWASYNLLAVALIRRAQETDNDTYYDQAQNALTKSLALSAHNFETEKIQISILLGRHEYPSALDAAKALNRRTPDDVMVYGLLTDADVVLGNYPEAEDAAQWMLNLRPGNLPALIRAANLRELYGDEEGARELLDLAYQSTPPSEPADRAALLTTMGNLRLTSGAREGAEKLFQEALTSFPSYPAAMASLAAVRMQQKRYDEAIGLLRQSYRLSAQTGQLYLMAEALQLAGREQEANKLFAEFETQALVESDRKNNANRQLVFFYADHAHQPAKALKLAQQECAWRHDVYTLDSYAWALHVNGRDGEARKQIDTALAVGIRDPQLFRHAEEIARTSGDLAAAARYQNLAAAVKTPEPER
jgi:tetratricopeptide (TPR) repeat protein